MAACRSRASHRGTAGADPARAAPRRRADAGSRRGCRRGQATPLDRADQTFLRIYQLAANDAIADLPIAWVAVGDRIAIYEHGQRTGEAVYLPNIYTQLKNVAHVSLATLCVLDAADGAPMTGIGLESARTLRDDAKASLASLDTAGFSVEQLPRQRALLDTSIAVLDRVVAGEVVSAGDQARFAETVAPLQLTNAGDAARAQLERVNEAVTKLAGGLTAAQRDHLHVVVGGAHQARDENVLMQYFRKLFREEGPIEHRVIYAEAVFEEAGAMSLLGKHLLDAGVSEQFFQQRRRLQIDLLGPAAERILPSLELPSLLPAKPAH
jgi:hypothetical protein